MANGIVNVLLAQTGEGIKECELIQWHVKVSAFSRVRPVSQKKLSRNLLAVHEHTQS